MAANRSGIQFIQAAYTLIGSLQSAPAGQMHTVQEMRKCGNLCLMAHSNMAGYQHTQQYWPKVRQHVEELACSSLLSKSGRSAELNSFLASSGSPSCTATRPRRASGSGTAPNCLHHMLALRFRTLAIKTVPFSGAVALLWASLAIPHSLLEIGHLSLQFRMNTYLIENTLK